MQSFTARKLYKVLLIAIFFIALIFFNPANFFNPLRSALLICFSPFQKVAYSFSLGFENTRDFLSSVGKLKQENEQLLKQNQQLLSENIMLKDEQNENALLRQQLSLVPRDRFDLAACDVVSQDPSGTGNWIEIDKGSDDGLSKGMPVIYANGILVGRLDQVDANQAKVMLLTNPQSTINVATNQNGTKGVVKGEYGLGIIFDMILQTDQINVGDDVTTSGIGGDIPRGLYVGKVDEIHPSEDHLFQQAVVTSPIQATKLQLVFVIKNNK